MGYKRIVKLKSKIARLKEKNKQLRKERDMYKRMYEILMKDKPRVFTPPTDQPVTKSYVDGGLTDG